MLELSATQLHTHFIQGKLSAEEIVQFYLKRIEIYNPDLGAFLSVLKEKAIQKARLLDQKRAQKKPLGRLAGVPIAIKDNIHIKGEKTTCASKMLENYIAPFNATVVELLENEDAILIGKTNLDEFAMGSSNESSAFFIAKNPWDLNCSPGGSSGGSAAAVSARLCPIALGSDTGGSIRLPAAFSGVIGYKPTYGRVSRNGLVAFGSSLDVIGPLANRTKDIALCMEVMGKHDEKDSTTFFDRPDELLSQLENPIEKKVIGVPWKALEGLGPLAKENFMQSLKTMEALGCIIKEVDLDLLQYSIAVYYILATAEASTNLARFDGVRYGMRQKGNTLEEMYLHTRHDGFGPEVKRRIWLGTYVLSSSHRDAFYIKAQKVRTLFIEQYKKAFKMCDVIVMPTAVSSAIEIGGVKDPIQMYLQDLYTISTNLVGLPAISVPSGFSSKTNNPFGIQFIGPQKQDAKVLNFANQFEHATQFTNAIPPFVKKEIF
jgi:aspartyl-tRNA(Asn)/glutamyl-tRNA(Gln) amidotransferase subunit A